MYCQILQCLLICWEWLAFDVYVMIFFFWNRLSSTVVFPLLSVSVNICFFSLFEGWYFFFISNAWLLECWSSLFGSTGWMINEYYSFVSRNQHESQKTCRHQAPSLVHIPWRAHIKVKRVAEVKEIILYIFLVFKLFNELMLFMI